MKLFPRYPKIAPSLKDYSKQLLALIKKYKFEDRTIIQSFDYRALVEIKNISKKVKTALLTENNLLPYSLFLKKIKVDILSPNMNWIVKSEVDKLHAQGIKVVPWTANTKRDWKYLIEAGVDGIITDDPASLIQYLKEKGLRK